MVGGSSLLIIFAVLCLTVLAMLSLSTAQSNDRLSRASAESVTAYYAADAQAEETLTRLRRGEAPDGVTVSENGAGTLYEYAVPISDTQELSVSMCLEGADWEILRWKAVSTADWTPDDSIEVWDGEAVPF
jgi:Tfp pilus assembly protein PilX